MPWTSLDDVQFTFDELILLRSLTIIAFLNAEQ